VTVLGRNAAAGEAALAEMRAAGSPTAQHAFIPLDAFRIAAVRDAAAAITTAGAGAPLDVLFLSQGMATLQGFTPTAEGLDEKLALHVYSRVALTRALLPLLRRAPAPRVISVLSAGVHAPYAHWREDPDLCAHYSIKNAADFAGLCNDVAADALAREPGNERVLFVHAAPGVVATNWGAEFPALLRLPLRLLQRVAPLRSPADCAEAMLDTALDARRGDAGWRLVGADGQAVSKTAVHDEARELLWSRICAIVDPILAA
jgi:NAD(P)-dependent dehydrogenase (short-subunit alcohol dehydrogenase family)